MSFNLDFDPFKSNNNSNVLNNNINTQASSGNSSQYLYDWVTNSTKSYSTPEFAGASQNQHRGMKSLFNKYALYSNYGNNLHTYGQSNFVMQNMQNEKTINKYTSPKIETLLADWDKTMAGQKYNLSDFLYCKYYGMIPNNRLVTLRRFPMPVMDSLFYSGTRDNKNLEPIAQAVTWFSEEVGNKLSDFMSFSGGLNWKDLEGAVHEVEIQHYGGSDGFDFKDELFGGGNSKIGNAASNIFKTASTAGDKSTAEVNSGDHARNQQYQRSLYSEGSYWNRVYGPVNVITKTKARDRGMEFSHKIELKFQYILKGYGSISPKMAMLDLFCNLLSIVSNNAKFWGGANRFWPQYGSEKMLGGAEAERAWLGGDYNSYFKNVGENLLSGATGIGKFFNDVFSGILSGDFSGALGKLLQGGNSENPIGMILDKKSSQGKPAIPAIKSLLTGAPIGEWHLVIGNPFNPIMMIGNLICTGYSFSFSDEINFEGFPEEMTFSVTLEHGRARDKSDFESMFNSGRGRMYWPQKGLDDILNASASTENSKVTTADTLSPEVQRAMEAQIG